MKLWAAETVSQLGTQVAVLALPLAAIGPLHATPFEVGVLTTAEFLPFILVGVSRRRMGGPAPPSADPDRG
jgi:hypothetical protein